jgi:predicted CopG family antitoxin
LYINSNKTFTSEFLLDWMIKNDVFGAIWDYKRTHLQLVQRSDEIFKLLLKENKLTEDLMKLFWSLTKSELHSEVKKIIQDCSFYLRPPQIVFFIDELIQIPTDKFTNVEFELLCELGNRKSDELERISHFFWQIISCADQYK